MFNKRQMDFSWSHGDTLRYIWCYEHICRVIDDEFERIYLEEDDYVL